MDVKKRIITSWLFLFLAIVSATCIVLWKRSYVFSESTKTLALRADSLLSVKLKLEEQLIFTRDSLEKIRLQNKQLSEKLLQLKQVKGKGRRLLTNDDLKKNLEDIAEVIGHYHSQMKSLITINEKLEKQVEILAAQMP